MDQAMIDLVAARICTGCNEQVPAGEQFMVFKGEGLYCKDPECQPANRPSIVDE